MKRDHEAAVRRIKALSFSVGSFASMQRRCQVLTGQNTSILYPGDFRKQIRFMPYRLQSALALLQFYARAISLKSGELLQYYVA